MQAKVPATETARLTVLRDLIDVRCHSITTSMPHITSAESYENNCNEVQRNVRSHSKKIRHVADLVAENAKTKGSKIIRCSFGIRWHNRRAL